MIRVMIVDDSSTSRLLLRHIVESSADMQIIAEVDNGQKAIEQAQRLRPNVILMDVVMPKMDGLEATGEIMRTAPTPIVMVSSAIKGREAEMAFQAIKRGALTLLSKPDGPGHPTFESQRDQLISTIRAMSGVRVIHHIPKQNGKHRNANGKTPLQQTLTLPPAIVGIASSTGGPAALAELFQSLKADFPLPIVVVQHMAGDFLPSLMNWLSNVCALPVRMAQVGLKPDLGVYLAPAGSHLYIDAKKQFASTDIPATTHMPSGDVLLESIAHQYGAAAVGIVLTGMGRDGACGLKQMRDKGAVTIAQDEKTSAVYGMPGEAKRLDAVQYELALNKIAPILADIVDRKHHE